MSRSARGDERGALALLLHSHMPYVEGFDTWPFGEEWLWEAVACVYLPLLEVLEGADVTVGLTPVLCDQLEALRGGAGERFVAFLRDVRAPVHAMDASGLEQGGESELAAEVRRAAGDYGLAGEQFEARDRDLLAAFRALEGPSLWTSAATHAVLPLVATDAGRRLQLGTGVASHRRRFGAFGGGLWIPECAYEAGLEPLIAEQGARAFCVDQTEAFGLGAPEQLEPVATEAGPVAVPIDWETIRLAWDPAGYPAHPTYRNYHGRTIHDLKPWSNGGRPYRHGAALALAREHAADFVSRVVARLDDYRARRGRPGLLTCALDTELLGHWWYEGPEWLREVLAESRRRGLALVALPAGLDRVEPVTRPLAASSWGIPKDLSTWDSPAVADLVWTARRAELSTVAAAARAPSGDPKLARAARELLALQSSDWAFLTTRRLADDYPQRRVAAHAAAHADALAPGGLAEPAVRNLAPDLDPAVLAA